MTYKDKRDMAHVEQAVQAAYMAGELERLALQRVTVVRAANGISIEDVEIKSTDLTKFVKEKGYTGWKDYVADIIAIENCRNNPVTLIAKPEPVRRQREFGGCYERMVRSITSKRKYVSMF